MMGYRMLSRPWLVPRTLCKARGGLLYPQQPSTFTKDRVMNSQMRFAWIEAALLGEGRPYEPHPHPALFLLGDVCPDLFEFFTSPAMLTLT